MLRARRVLRAPARVLRQRAIRATRRAAPRYFRFFRYLLMLRRLSAARFRHATYWLLPLRALPLLRCRLRFLLRRYAATLQRHG